jgi:cytoskeletal protein CcmA (bactofilin family)
MWKKEDGKSSAMPEISTTPAGTANAPAPAVSQSNDAPAHTASLPLSPLTAACISQGIRINGEVTGSEDLFVDGVVDGKLTLANGSLTIGPNGQVKADVTAREVIVRGKVTGKVTARDKVLLGSTGQVDGEVQTDRLAIEDGAGLRGKVEAGKKPAKAPELQAAAAAAAGSAGKGSSTTPVTSGTAAD